MKKALLALSVSFALALSFTTSHLAFADAKSLIGQGVQKTSSADSGHGDLGEVAKNVIGVMMFIIGVLSVIVIIYSGILFVIAAGNPQTIQKAKTSMIYAIIGLIVAMFAYAIVNFVVNGLGGSGGKANDTSSDNSNAATTQKE